MGCSHAKAPVTRIMEDKGERMVPKQMGLYQHGELRCGLSVEDEECPGQGPEVPRGDWNGPEPADKVITGGS